MTAFDARSVISLQTPGAPRNDEGPLPAAGLLPFAAEEFRCAGARVLVVDDEPLIHDIMKLICKANGIEAQHAHDGEEALEIIRRDPPDLVITDVRMPRMDGWELCSRIKSNPDTVLLPVLMLTSFDAMENKVRSFDLGADEHMSKPFHQVEMVARMRAMLRWKSLRDHLESAERVIFTLARTVEAKDTYTAGHIERVSSFAVDIGRQMGLGEAECLALQSGGVLHDIGKIGVPDSILNKPGKLTDDEFDLVRRHPVVGEQICSEMKTLRHVLDLIRHHHERLDGSGYPDGLTGDQVTMAARIMAVCDVYDALTSTRSYRAAMGNEKAFAILDEGVRAGHWDRKVVQTLKEVATERKEPPSNADQEDR